MAQYPRPVKTISDRRKLAAKQRARLIYEIKHSRVDINKAMSDFEAKLMRGETEII